MEIYSEKAIKGLQRAILALQMCALYIKPYRYPVLKTVHIIYCCVILFYIAFSTIQAIVMIWKDNNGRPILTAQSIVLYLSVLIIMSTTNLRHSKMEVVLKNCLDTLKSDAITLKAKRKCLVAFNTAFGFCISFIIFGILVDGFYFGFGLGGDKPFTQLLYPLKATQLNGPAYYTIGILSYISKRFICCTFYVYLPWVNICITYIEMQLFTAFNKEVEEYVNMTNSPAANTTRNIEKLRLRHLELTKIIKQHNEMIKLPVAVYFTQTIITCCLALYLVASASGFMQLASGVMPLFFGILNFCVILWSGISLNHQVSDIFLVYILSCCIILNTILHSTCLNNDEDHSVALCVSCGNSYDQIPIDNDISAISFYYWIWEAKVVLLSLRLATGNDKLDLFLIKYLDLSFVQ